MVNGLADTSRGEIAFLIGRRTPSSGNSCLALVPLLAISCRVIAYNVREFSDVFAM